MDEKKLDNVVNFLFEVGILSKTPRSGFYFLGSGEQSVAEHLNRVCFIGYVLATLEGDVDMAKVLKLCLFHDLGEARTSDLNYVHQKYAQADELKAVEDLAGTLEFGDEILSLVKEARAKETKEAKVAKDADQLELLLSLKEQKDIGNSRAEAWMNSTVKRLKTDAAKKVAEKVLTTDSDAWWFGNKEDEWWVSRNKEVKK